MTSGSAPRGDDLMAAPPFIDALTGGDGTADPVITATPPMIYADPTADGSMTAAGFNPPAIRLPVPAPVVIDPQAVARADAELARLAEKDRVEQVYAVAARRDAAIRSTAARRQPAAPSAGFATTNWLPPGVPDAVRKALAQAQAQTAATANQLRPPAPPAPLTPGRLQRPAPPPGPSAPTKRSGSGALGVFIFIVVLLFATGLGQKLITAVQQLINR